MAARERQRGTAGTLPAFDQCDLRAQHPLEFVRSQIGSRRPERSRLSAKPQEGVTMSRVDSARVDARPLPHRDQSFKSDVVI